MTDSLRYLDLAGALRALFARHFEDHEDELGEHQQAESLSFRLHFVADVSPGSQNGADDSDSRYGDGRNVGGASHSGRG